MGTVAPVAQTNARLFTDMATTFAAISKSPSDLEQTIARSPSTEQVSTQSLKVQRPFLVDLNTSASRWRRPPSSSGTRCLTSIRQSRPAPDARAHAGAQRQPPAGDGRAEEPVPGAGTNVAVNALTSTVRRSVRS